MSIALIIIDMQQFVADRIQQGISYYPDRCIDNMVSALSQCRQLGYPVVHVRHQSLEKDSLFNANSPAAKPLSLFEERTGEAVFIKTTSSAFASTELFAYLQTSGVTDIVVIGAVAGFCVTSTVRAGADLGLRITVLEDAVISFELPNDGLPAAQIHQVTCALLAADFASVMTNEVYFSAQAVTPIQTPQRQS